MPHGPSVKPPKNNHSRRHHDNQHARRQTSGLSLIEISISMMILAILSLGVSSLVKTGVEGQMARRTEISMQSIGMDIVDDIRRDTQTAASAAITGGGNTLALTTTEGVISYQLASNGQFTRRNASTGASKTYNDPLRYNQPQFSIVCPQSCFTALSLNSDPTPIPRQIQVNEIQVRQVMPNNNSGNIIDNAFGPANFTVRRFSFNLISATEFQ